MVLLPPANPLLGIIEEQTGIVLELLHARAPQAGSGRGPAGQPPLEPADLVLDDEPISLLLRRSSQDFAIHPVEVPLLFTLHEDADVVFPGLQGPITAGVAEHDPVLSRGHEGPFGTVLEPPAAR